MPQYARPVNTTDQGAAIITGASTVHEAIDDVVANDATDYIRPWNQTFVVGLSSTTNPGTTSGFSIVSRMRSNNGSNANPFFYLKKPGNVMVAQWSPFFSGTAWQTMSYNLTAAEAAKITNFSELTFEGMDGYVNTLITQMYLQVPDPPIVVAEAEIISVAAPKISPATGKNSVAVTWRAPKNFTSYEIRIVPSQNSPVTAGTRLETNQSPANGGTSGVDYTSTITYAEMQAAAAVEGNNILRVFVM